MHVQDGDTVTRGQLLYETVTGSLDGLYATSNQIVSDVDGIIASVNASVGGTISKGDTLLTVYPRDKMQVVIEIDEYDLADIHEGDTLQLEFNYDDSSDSIYTGTVTMISHISASSDTSEVSYKAYINFVPNAEIRLGMSVLVSTTEEEADVTEADEDEVVEPGETPAETGEDFMAPAEDITEAVGD